MGMSRTIDRRTLLGAAAGALMPGAALAQPRLRGVAAPVPRFAEGTLPMVGVNLSAASFAPEVLPGVHGRDYDYPTGADVAYVVRKGFSCIRLPFLWERLQPRLNGDFNLTQWSRLDAVVQGALANGLVVVLDPHNFGRWRRQVIGSREVPNSAFADLWARLASAYRSEPNVVFGLMNEPHDMPTEQWFLAANAASAAIRRERADNLILVSGNGYSTVESWQKTWYGTSNAEAIAMYRDPLDNWQIEVHAYFDHRFGGTSPICVSETIGEEHFVPFTAWLRRFGRKAWLGEFAGGANPTCDAAVTRVLDHIDGARDAWLGWAWWSAGPRWGDYFFSVQPIDYRVDRPQMAILERFARRARLPRS